MQIRNHLSPAAMLDRLIALAFRFGAFRLAEGLVCWGKGNHRQQYIHFRSADGVPLWLNPFNYIDRALLAEGGHDRHVTDAFQSLVQPGDVFWDVGANLGFISVSLLHKFPGLKIVAFEPSPFMFSQLYLNNQLHGDRMQILPLALADKEGFRCFSMKTNRNTGQSTLQPEEDVAYDTSFGVYCETGDRLIAAGSVPPPTLIKIDVEGAEGMVLRGLSAALQSPKLRAIVFEGPTKDHDAILDLLRQNGFPTVIRLTEGAQTNFLAQRG